MGLVRHSAPARTMTVISDDNGKGRYMGSLEYIAPEVWLGIERSGSGGSEDSATSGGAGASPSARRVASYTQTADIYSLGVAFFFILCRQQIHNGEAEAEVRRRCLAGELSIGHLYDARVSEDARDLLGHMLALEPRTRATAEQALAHRWFTGSAAWLEEARRLFGDEREVGK